MVKIEVDGGAYEVEAGQNLLHACLSLGFDIPYVQERQRQEQTAVLLPSGQIEGSALRLLELCRQPWQLIEPSRNACCRAGRTRNVTSAPL